MTPPRRARPVDVLRGSLPRIRSAARRPQWASWLMVAAAAVAVGCSPDDGEVDKDHGPIAAGISAPLGEPAPWASATQLATFARGKQVAERRFMLADGLGPAFNVTFCASCHEKPAAGGSAGLYRNFFLTGRRFEDGAFVPAKSAGEAGGVMRMYDHGPGRPARPPVPETTNVIAQRNAVPFFGVGLLAELDGEEILRRADPDDRDGDGVSGRPNWDRGFVGRFGRKAQTTSIEGFIRGPLFNHAGITTDPLTQSQKAALPVDSSNGPVAWHELLAPLRAVAQAAAVDGPLTDDDGVADPELSTSDLFDLVSFAMLLAAPAVEPETPQTAPGRRIFDRLGCAACHTPRLAGPRGPLPMYSDILLHDMGPELADGLEQGEATGSEFRTQPLWGLTATGPWLHDGRAGTVREAIELHGGEASRSRDAAVKLSESEWVDLLAFLASLGGREQQSDGMLMPLAPVPAAGDWGGPSKALSPEDLVRFRQGRALFDREFGLSAGLGGPRFNGDSCRACHFEPVIGGAGPRGVNVMRHGLQGPDGGFVAPAVGTILHKQTALRGSANRPQKEAVVFEHRQTPHLFGLGLIEGIADQTILARADPDDADGDGISGRVSRVDGGRLGRFGHKAQVPTLTEFVRDAVTAELGMTLPWVDARSFGAVHDNDGVADPELTPAFADGLLYYLRTLAPPPRAKGQDPVILEAGAKAFSQALCDRCHVPALKGAEGDVPLYSDLLLHEVWPAGTPGIEEASAGTREFRTAPLWGLRATAPYMHSGAADTIAQAIALHDGEAKASREAWDKLDEGARKALLAFLGSL